MQPSALQLGHRWWVGVGWSSSGKRGPGGGEQRAGERSGAKAQSGLGAVYWQHVYCVVSRAGGAPAEPLRGLPCLAQQRSRAAGIEVELMGLSAEQLPTADASFDTVVCTYTLCTIPDAAQALREMRRVLVPGGKLLFCEHGRAPDENVRRWQDRLQPLWGPLVGGCQLGRDIPGLLDAAGFTATTQAAYLAGPRPMTFHYWGEAQAA